MKYSPGSYDLECVVCGAINDEQQTTTYCTSCDGVLTIRYHNTSDHIQWPLKKALPDPITTGYTTLRHLKRMSEAYGAEVWGKLELENPTGCFKDRGSLVEVLKAIELGADAICLASTGNMAASVAAYARYFHLPCFVFVPEQTAEAKLAQATIHDANIIRVKGDFKTCIELCREFADSGNYYLAGDYVFRGEGQKVFSYELIEQGGTDFDYIIVPVGCGTNFAAIWKGFTEARDGGLIDQLPRMVAVQPDGASPVVEGIFKKEKIIKDAVHTMAKAVAASDPLDFYKVLSGIQESGGEALTTTEEEILVSMREMATEEGVFSEPSGALPLAVVKNNPDLFKGKKVLLVITGTGLKDTGVVAKHSLPSPVLDNDLREVQHYIDSGYIDLQKQSWGGARDNVLANFQMRSGQQKQLQRYLKNLTQKGKTLTPEEMEALQVLVVNEQSDIEYPAELVDYDVTMRRNGLVEAELTFNIDGEDETAAGKGVGPLDAVLSTCKLLTNHLYAVNVVNHNIEVLSPATHSLIMASVTLEHAGREYTVKSASSDIIEGTIDAFLKGLAVIKAKSVMDQQKQE